MNAWTAWLLSHLWLTLLLSSLVVLAAMLLASRYRDPVARHRILVAFLPVLALLPVVQLIAGEAAPRTNPAIPAHTGAAGRPDVDGGGDLDRATHGALVGPAAAPTALSVFAPPAQSRIAPIAAACYLLGASLLFSLIALRAAQTLRLLRTCAHVREPRVLAIWLSLLRPRPTRRADLLQSAHAPTPGCWGILRPRVVLPSREVAAPDADRLSLVLRHELVHLSRCDVHVALAQQVVRALLWFNPLVWLYSTLVSRYRELSCDAIVVRQTGKHQSYALALLEYCRPRTPHTARRRIPILGLAMADGCRTQIRRRLDMILTEQQHRASRPAPRRLLAACASLALAGSVAAAAMFGPGPAPALQPEPKADPAKEVQPEAPKSPDARIRLIETRLLLEKSRDLPWHDLSVEIPPVRRSALPLLEIQGLVNRGARPQEGELTGAITEQETLVSGEKVAVRGNLLLAPALTLNMPEGSRLRSMMQGESITVAQREPMEVKVTRGLLRLIDDTGVSRVTVRVAPEPAPKPTDKAPEGAAKKETPPDGVLIITIAEDKGEVVMQFKATKADGSPADIQAELDLKTGVPADEKDPPPGAVRFRLFDADRAEGKPLRVKMQWVHDLSKISKEEPKEKPPERANTAR